MIRWGFTGTSRTSPLEGLSGGALYFDNRCPPTDELSSKKVISVSDAMRLNSGNVKIQGMISSVHPLRKMICCSSIICNNCNYEEKIPYEKPEFVQQKVQVPQACTNCNDSDFTVSHEYINSIEVELRDTDTLMILTVCLPFCSRKTLYRYRW